MKTKYAFYMCVLVALGCTKKTIQQNPNVPHPASAVRDSIRQMDSTTSPISPVQLFHAGSVVYNYRTASIVRVVAGDTIPRVDTTTVTAVVLAEFQPLPDGYSTIQAVIGADSIMVRTGSSTAVQFASYVDSLRINLVSGKVTATYRPKASCDIKNQEALVRVDDVVPIIPRIQTGSWSDTLVRDICRAGIQLYTRRITSYQLDSIGANFRLLRTAITTFSGRGTQSGQPVESTGQSTTVDTVFLDLTSQRRIQRVQGMTQLVLNFKSQFHNQQFEQLTNLSVQLR